MCTVGTCGLHGWAITETPAAQKRGSLLGARNLRREFGREGAVNDRQVRAHLLEQAPAQHRHPPAAAGRAAGVGALPGLDREPAGRDLGAGVGELALKRLHRLDDPPLDGLEPIARACEARVVGRRRRNVHGDVSPRTRATRRSTCPTGVSGRTPWPRLKIWARVARIPRGRARPRRRGAVRRRRAPADRDCPAARTARAGRRSAAFGSTAVSRPIASMSARAREFRQLRPGAARKGDDRRVRRLGPDLGRERRHRRDAPAIEFGRRQHAGPGIEDLHRFRARRQLTDQVFGRGVDEPVDQGREQVRMAIGEEPRRRLIRRPAPGDHVARHRPRRAAEADQRDIARQRGLEAVESFEHGREPVPVGLVG